jgi:hypothetical protein
MTVVDFVTDVLRQLAIISEIATPSAEQGQDAVTKLNDLMADLAEDGIERGYNPKATSAETLVLPDGDKAGIKAMLGVRICEGYGMPVLPVMAAMANAWYNRALRNSLHQTMRAAVSDAPIGEHNGSTYDIERGY